MMQNGKINFGGPFVFGMNVGFTPDGKPIASPFGNVRNEEEGNIDVKSARDPMVDIYEEEGQTVVVVEVPGVNKNEIELRASPHELEIIAESKITEGHPRKYHKIVSLPNEINPDIAKARYNNGILEVRLEKIIQGKTSKKINIE